MKCNLSLLAVLVAPFALADSIAFGDFSLDGTTGISFMWIEGPDPCQYARAGGPGFAFDCSGEFLNECTVNENPCGHKFTLKNGKSYRMEGCGTSDFTLHYYSSGTYISTATFAPWSSNCGDSSGNWRVFKTWQFQCDKAGC